MSMIAVRMATAETAPLEAFVACAHQMLDPGTPEAARRAIEPRLVAMLPALRALGVFELFELRHPALRAWLEDEMREGPH